MTVRPLPAVGDCVSHPRHGIGAVTSVSGRNAFVQFGPPVSYGWAPEPRGIALAVPMVELRIVLGEEFRKERP